MAGRPAVASPLKALEADLARVQQVVLGVLRERGAVVSGPGSHLFQNGGKRLRPALVLLCSRLFGPQPEEAIPIAAAVEMVHGASLLHDDVIDNTALRRGRATLNAEVGNRYSVLLGDLLLTEALRAVCRLGRIGCVQVVSDAVAEMTLGQLLELAHQGDLDTGTGQYLRIVTGKTASLMACGCKLGGLLGQASEAEVEALGRFGRNLGVAFQIVDDVLDFWGDPALLGKPVGSDLRERKYTLPLLYTMQQADPPRRERVRALLGNGRLEADGLGEILALMDEFGARRHSLETARQFTLKAAAELGHLPAGEARQTLFELLDFVMCRDH
ncbi:MAG TPA: polyprenyl synthetase family protein [Candidatus Nitrosotenuis sp.]|jgi:octaprenyl-diphosphate synthase|nr:polyprenyl synthetase family protein [Candidatus Nitrosotenuis sp.]